MRNTYKIKKKKRNTLVSCVMALALTESNTVRIEGNIFCKEIKKKKKIKGIQSTQKPIIQNYTDKTNIIHSFIHYIRIKNT